MGIELMPKLMAVHENRSEGIGGSDAKRIADGDWLPLYREKVGEAEPVDLSRVFPVQLGSYTEQFHLEWVARREGWTIRKIDGRLYHSAHPFMFANLDGWVENFGLPIETKHCNGASYLREKAQYYMPQIQHYLAVTQAEAMIFSMIAGNTEPDHCRVDRDQEYIDHLVELERAFWWHVTERDPPEALQNGDVAQLKAMAKAVPIDGLKDYDMQGSNEWGAHASAYIKHENAAKSFDLAKAALKGLVPEDAASCTGYGLTIKRSKNGSLRFA
jgi:predicted phage-related endonuclease